MATMRTEIGGLIADVFPPERAKFKSPVILVHGLWSGGWCWESWATHLANLGWECWAIHFRGRAVDRDREILQRLTLGDCVTDLNKVVASSPSPPLLIGHCLGASVAAQIAASAKVSALMLVCPMPSLAPPASLSRPLRLLRLKYWPLLFLNRPFTLEEKDFRRLWLGPMSQDQQEKIISSMVPDSTHLVRELFARSAALVATGARCPVLIVAGAEDRVTSVAALRQSAAACGADFKEFPGHGHWILDADDGEEIVRDIHGWVVQKLGEEILLAEITA